MKEGVDGLLHDKNRPSRIPPLGREAVERVVAPTQRDLPTAASHWTADMLAQASGVTARTVWRIRKAHGLQRRRYHQIKLSIDPKLVT